MFFAHSLVSSVIGEPTGNLSRKYYKKAVV